MGLMLSIIVGDQNDTVDAEILHQLIGILSHYLQGLIHPWWCRISSINSTPNPKMQNRRLLGYREPGMKE